MSERSLRRAWDTGLAIVVVAFAALAAPPARSDPGAVLPDGSGRAAVERACSTCHSLENITRTHRTRAQWESKIDEMIARGARITDEDIDVIAGYLAEYFGTTGGG